MIVTIASRYYYFTKNTALYVFTSPYYFNTEFTIPNWNYSTTYLDVYVGY